MSSGTPKASCGCAAINDKFSPVFKHYINPCGGYPKVFMLNPCGDYTTDPLTDEENNWIEMIGKAEAFACFAIFEVIDTSILSGAGYNLNDVVRIGCDHYKSLFNANTQYPLKEDGSTATKWAKITNREAVKLA